MLSPMLQTPCLDDKPIFNTHMQITLLGSAYENHTIPFAKLSNGVGQAFYL